MILGNESRLALEVIDSVEERHQGQLFLYVNGIKFGNDALEYDVDLAIENVVNYFTINAHDYGNLFDCPREIIFEAFDIAFGLIERSTEDGLGANNIDKYYPNFFSQFDHNDDLDACFFRLGNYMFDTSSLLLVPKANHIRLFVRNDKNNQSTDLVTTNEEFISLWSQLAKIRLKSLRK